MKTLLAIILIPVSAIAEGITLYDKTTGQLYEKFVPVVVTNEPYSFQRVNTNVTPWTTNTVDVPETVVTNQVLAWAKLQPPATTWTDTRALGSQVLKGIDWSRYDLARYKQVKHDPPATIADLVQVEPFGVYEIQQEQSATAASMAGIQAASESNLVAIARSCGYTNVPLDWVSLAQYGQQVTATNLMAGMAIRLQVLEQLQFYVLNGGDARKVGRGKSK